ncbi:MAG: hypothetical protein K0Q73_3633 [Paenibacillus sp.]|jgi:hypothetical protein|nr:hypothetical protein [Paenibacillus sp.]
MLNEQLIPMFYFSISFILILVFIPWLFFRNAYQDGVERITADFLKMCGILVVLGYVLVLFKLFEMLSVVFLLVFIGNRIYRVRQKKAGLDETATNFETMIYEYFDGKYTLKQVLIDYVSHMYVQIKEMLRLRFSGPVRIIGTVSCLSVIGLAGYIRYYDVLFHGAPSYGNQYTSLKWIKDIRENILFTDGVLPQGFYVFWATVQEFARIDTLHMVNYTGALSSILTMLGIYFFISRLTENKLGSIVGVTLFALAGEFIDPLYWQWQAEADPRTFAYVFLLPTLYFLILFLRGRNRDAFRTMFAGMLVIALMDPVSLLLLLLGVFLVIMFLFLGKKKIEGSSISKAYLSWGTAAAISILPIGIGLVSGKHIHIAFIQMFQSNPVLPFMLSAAPSILILLICVAVGFIWHYCFRVFRGSSLRKLVEAGIIVVIIVISIGFASLRPVQSLKIDWDEAVAQYVRITKEHPPQSWMIVGKDTWNPLARGMGYHMSIDELVNNYDPSKMSLTRNGAGEPDTNIAPNVFIYYEKRLREVDNDAAAGQLASLYKEWDKDMKDLKVWLDRYALLHPKAKVYYEDDNIAIYHLEYVQDRKEANKQIWGGGE